MSHQKHSGSAVHPVHTGTSKLMLEVTHYPSCRSALRLGRRCFALAVDECQVSALWESAKVDGSEHRDFHMIPPLSHHLCFFPHLTVFQSYFPSWSRACVSVTEMHSVSTPLTSSTIAAFEDAKIWLILTGPLCGDVQSLWRYYSVSGPQFVRFLSTHFFLSLSLFPELFCLFLWSGSQLEDTTPTGLSSSVTGSRFPLPSSTRPGNFSFSRPCSCSTFWQCRF